LTVVCVRRAWLVMSGAFDLPLEDEAAGYFCESLDLGYPQVREVTTNVPDGDGVDDRTQFFGARVVTADVVALDGAGAVIDEVASQFARFMLPSTPAELHYVLDRPGATDNPLAHERVVTVRASQYAWPIRGDQRRDIHLQWLAADPIIYGAEPHDTFATSGSSVQPGRAYDLAFDREYPQGQGYPVNGNISSTGEVGVRPSLRLFGPISGPRITFTIQRPNAPLGAAQVGFRSTFQVGPGQYVDIDTVARTAFLNGNQGEPVVRFLDWANLAWPYVPPAPARSYMSLIGQNTSDQTRVVASWRDAYLT
jgi:hypothetical protein